LSQAASFAFVTDIRRVEPSSTGGKCFLHCLEDRELDMEWMKVVLHAQVHGIQMVQEGSKRGIGFLEVNTSKVALQESQSLYTTQNACSNFLRWYLYRSIIIGALCRPFWRLRMRKASRVSGKGMSHRLHPYHFRELWHIWIVFRCSQGSNIIWMKYDMFCICDRWFEWFPTVQCSSLHMRPTR
jgi:hypothetical protein